MSLYKIFTGWKERILRPSLVRSEAKKLLSALDAQERIPIYFDRENIEAKNLLAHGERLLSILHDGDHRKKILRRMTALRYRLEGVNGGWDPSLLRYQKFKILSNLAITWKREQNNFDTIDLSMKEIDRLNAASVYPAFVDILENNPSLLHRFMLWAIRDKIDPVPFILYPSLTDELGENGLQQRIGRMGGDQLQINIESGQKVLTLPFEGIWRSILDPHLEIVFQEDYRLSIEQIFSIFKKKNHESGTLEYFANGIVNWSPLWMGRWNPTRNNYVHPNLDHDKWWEDLPHFETISSKEAAQRYRLPVDGSQWVVACHVTREHRNLSYEDTHAFFQVAIPTEQREYRIYDFGKYGTSFPKSSIDILRLFAKTMPATIMYPDDNVYYSHREEGYFPFPISPSEGIQFMEMIKEDIYKGWEGQMAYQIESDNCAKWTFETLAKLFGEDALPNMYRMSLLDTEPVSPIRFLLRGIKYLPKRVQAFVMTRLHYPLAPWRGLFIKEREGMKWKSLCQHNFWKTAEVYLPALLLKKIRHDLFSHEEVHTQEITTWSKILRLLPTIHWESHLRNMQAILEKALADCLVILRCLRLPPLLKKYANQMPKNRRLQHEE